MKSGIYSITCLENNKMYIGYATNIHNRWTTHKAKLRNKRHSNEHLQSAWNLYSESSFLFEIIEECDKSLLLALEHYWCTILKVHDRNYGYNNLPTHPYSRLYTHSEETKAKIRDKRKFQVFSEETRQRISKAGKGRKMTDENKKKLRESNRKKGWRHTIEARIKIADRKGWKHREETRLKISATKKKQGLKPMLGKQMSKEAKEKCRQGKIGENNPMYGKHLSQEHKMRISLSIRRKHNNLI